MKINIINNSKHRLPRYETIGSAGMDLKANIDNDIILKPLERILVPTGLHISLPSNYEAQIRPRSGLAYKHGITVLNTPGTIDSDYTGEIKAILINLSNDDFIIKDGDRICQMIINNIEQVELIEVESLIPTERGDGGFGHTNHNYPYLHVKYVDDYSLGCKYLTDDNILKLFIDKIKNNIDITEMDITDDMFVIAPKNYDISKYKNAIYTTYLTDEIICGIKNDDKTPGLCLFINKNDYNNFELIELGFFPYSNYKRIKI